MSRSVNGGWDFIEKGKMYQYKESSLILIVEILEDNSDEDGYSFDLNPIAGNMKIEKFSVYASKRINGCYNGMSQFFDIQEYIPLPVGVQWNFVADEEKLNLYNKIQLNKGKNYVN